MKNFQAVIAAIVLGALLSAAKADEGDVAIRVKAEDPAISLAHFGLDAKKKSTTGSHRVGFRFSITNTAQGKKNGQLFFKLFDKEGFELTNPGNIYEARTALEPGEVRKAVAEVFFEPGEWEKVREVELYWRPLKYLDK